MRRVLLFLLMLVAAGAVAWFLQGDAGDRPAPLPPVKEARPVPPASAPESEPPQEQPAPAGASLAGMAWIAGGPAWIGTQAGGLDDLLDGRSRSLRKFFLYEFPRHEVALLPYYIGKYEVSNAQYRRFLADQEAVYDVEVGTLCTLDSIAAHLVGLSKMQAENPRQVVWRQLYFANKDAIGKALGEKLTALTGRRPDGSVSEEQTARNLRRECLPPDVQLRFFRMRPPTNWPDMDPPRGEEDHPVRSVSYNDAAAFAEWAGGHLPTEQEWEWAARGPKAPRYPWGNDWHNDASRANWGGKVVDDAYRATTMPVDSLPAGRSWSGCQHMAGNVTEWTSSWFEAYPGCLHKNSRMGKWVKVIRGGGAGDGEHLVLRPACRNFVGGGADAPPYPENSFEWCGFRLAAYPDPVRDRLEPVVRRAARANKIKVEHLALDRSVGAATRHWVGSDLRPKGHVHALARSHAVLIIPVRSFLRDHGRQAMIAAWKRPARFKAVPGLAKRAAGETPEWLVGVLHTDIELDPVLVCKPLGEMEIEERKKRGPRGRGKPKSPPTESGTCAPGTYLLAIWFGKLCLLEPNKEFVCFLPARKRQKSQYRVKVVEPRPSVLAVDPVADWADVWFDMPLGGKGVKDTTRLVFEFRLLFEVGELELRGFPGPGD